MVTGFLAIDRVIMASKDQDAIAAWQQAGSMFRQQQGFNEDFERRIKALEERVTQQRP